MTTDMKKAPAATGAIRNRNTNLYEGVTMTTTVPHAADKFEALLSISVGTRGFARIEPDNDLVALRLPTPNENLTPAEACALAAALQAVAVHQMESQPREVRRMTEPGAPSFEEAI